VVPPVVLSTCTNLVFQESWWSPSPSTASAPTPGVLAGADNGEDLRVPHSVSSLSWRHEPDAAEHRSNENGDESEVSQPPYRQPSNAKCGRLRDEA
jgi:hypothetical protein